MATLLRAIDEYHGSFVVKCALQLAPLTFLRPKELRLAQWSEFDLDQAEWKIPIARMKRSRRDKEANPKEVHVVPLAKQAVVILRELQKLTGGGQLVFTGLRGKDRPISDATLTNALRQLSHAVDTPLGRAYDRTTFLPERKKMMQTWADYLDGIKAGAEIMPLRAEGLGGWCTTQFFSQFQQKIGYLGADTNILWPAQSDFARMDSGLGASVTFTPSKREHLVKCDRKMIRRKNRITKSTFWACPRYPKCKMTMKDKG